ncbi:AP-4 complex subunit sigma-1 [Holothuria leucospilota]|uniref:AP complex subunit sigma n=1 Tax=Holothuria leucospilota TaxID=206669 RepID=A0A9Q1CIG2_HOLLE|nr:AP-4 complex subunit sigma-1 [Holothuria leucospilota]
MLKFVLMITKKGQTRLSHYFERREIKDRPTLEADLLRKIRQRSLDQCSFFDYQDLRITYRLYQNIYIIVGTDTEENGISVLEFIQLFMEVLHTYFSPITEIDIMYNLDKVHMVLEEIVTNGCIVETCIANILEPMRLMDSKK